MANNSLNPYANNTSAILGGSRGFDPQAYSDYGKSLGIDVRGNNVLGDVFNHAAVGLAPRFLSSIGLGNSVEGTRESSLLDGIRNLSSSYAQQLQSNALRQALVGGASDQAAQAANQLGAAGGGIGAVQGARIQALNSANQTANNQMSLQASPEGQMQRQSALQQLIQMAQTPAGFQQLTQMFGPLEQRHQQNAREQAAGGLGGLLGSLGGVLGAAGAYGRRGGDE